MASEFLPRQLLPQSLLTTETKMCVQFLFSLAHFANDSADGQITPNGLSNYQIT